MKWILFDMNNNAIAQFDEPPITWLVREHGATYHLKDGTKVVCVNEHALANMTQPTFAPEAPQSGDLPGDANNDLPNQQ